MCDVHADVAASFGAGNVAGEWYFSRVLHIVVQMDVDVVSRES